MPDGLPPIDHAASYRQGKWLAGMQRARRAEREIQRRRAYEAMWKEYWRKQRGVIDVTEASAKLKVLEKRAKRAVSRAQARERRLFAHGQPLHPEEKHKELLAAIKSERNAVLNEVRAEAAQINQEHRAVVDQVQAGLQPQDALSGSERSTSEWANVLALTRSTFERANPAALATRLDYLSAHGSKIEKVAAIIAADEHAQELDAAGNTAAKHAFSGLLERLRSEIMEPVFQGRVSEAVGVVNTAMELEKFCWTRARDAVSMAGAYGNERYAIAPLIEKQRYEAGGKAQVAAPGGSEPPTGEVAS